MPNVPQFLSSTSGNVPTTELAIVGEEIAKSGQRRKHYNTNILENIELEVGNNVKVYRKKKGCPQ